MKIKITHGICLTIIAGFCLVASAYSAQSDYDGTYSGSYSGTSNGYWVFVLNTPEAVGVMLSYSPSTDDLDIGFPGYTGESFNQIASFIGETEVETRAVDIDITRSDGDVSGTWTDSEDQEGGDITGTLLNACSYVGSYSGSLSGDISGTWSASVDNDCTITGAIASGEDNRPIEGGVHRDGYIIFFSTDEEYNGVIGGGRITYSGTAGIWKSEDGSTGKFSTGDSDNDDNNTDASCFIQSLL